MNRLAFVVVGLWPDTGADRFFCDSHVPSLAPRALNTSAFWACQPARVSSSVSDYLWRPGPARDRPRPAPYIFTRRQLAGIRASTARCMRRDKNGAAAGVRHRATPRHPAALFPAAARLPVGPARPGSARRRHGARRPARLWVGFCFVCARRRRGRFCAGADGFIAPGGGRRARPALRRCRREYLWCNAANWRGGGSAGRADAP